MSLLLVAGLGLIFTALVLGVGTVSVLTQERRTRSRTLDALERSGTTGRVPDLMLQELERPFGERVVDPLTGLAGRLGRRLTPAGYLGNVDTRLAKAGSPEGWDADRVISTKGLGAVAGVAVGITLPLLLGAGGLIVVGMAIAFGLAGFFGVDMWLYQTAYDRRDVLRKALPDSMDLLSISVEAGLGFDAALSQVSRNTDGPLAAEFTRTLQEIQIGLGRVSAMRAMAERCDLPELSNFVGSLVQADTLGIPISRVLKQQSDELRLKRSQRAEEAAQKVPVKILFPLIFCILPALLLVVIGPAGINIFRNLTIG